MKFLLVFIMLSSHMALALDSVTEELKGEIVGSVMKRGDPLYTILYGFKSSELSDEGNFAKASVVIECRKRPVVSRSMNKSYITFIAENRRRELVKELDHDKCDELYDLMLQATEENPVDYSELL